MAQLESDKTELDANLVSFDRRAIKNNFLSKQAGHDVYEDVDYITITSPAPQGVSQPLNVIETPVRPDHKARYPRLYANFQAAMAGKAKQIGLPVEEWPILSRAQAYTLKAMGLATVEQIAATSDAQAQSFQMIGQGLREKAQNYLRALRSDDEAKAESEKREKAERENAELKERLAKLEAAMLAQHEAKVDPTPADEISPRTGKPKRPYNKKPKQEASTA